MRNTAVMVAGCLVAALILATGLRHRDSQAPEVSPVRSEFADRINTACRKGDTVFDWSVGDEFHAVPAGIVEVTCVHYGPGANIDQYKVAVPR